MTITHPDRLVADYLRRLDDAAAALHVARRAELVAEIRVHIDEAIREAGTAGEVEVRNILERLGQPEEIAAAAGSSMDPGSSRGKLETAALLTLALGGFVPVVGWAVGAVLVLASVAWSRRDKTVGFLLGLVPAFLVAALLLTIYTSETGLGKFEMLVLSWGFVCGLPCAGYLAYRLPHVNNASLGRTLTPEATAGN